METPVVGCVVATLAGAAVAELTQAHAYTAYGACAVAQFLYVSACSPRWAGLLWPASVAWAAHMTLGVRASYTWIFAVATAAALFVIGPKLKD